MPSRAPTHDAELRPAALTQSWERYAAEDHAVWRTLYARRMTTLLSTGSEAVLRGVERIALPSDAIPDLARLNAKLSPLTGWRAIPTGGFLEPRAFFSSLARREFPTTITIRPAHSLDYIPEPDIFHDVFGHVPLHSDPNFADALQRFGALAAEARDEEQGIALQRLFWFTVEFGLVLEGGAPRIYGSGLVSSAADAANALGSACQRRPFVLDEVMAQPFDIDHIQPVLFVIESFEALVETMEEAGRMLDLAA
jgi:phenylalanine-4-hydroxylase